MHPKPTQQPPPIHIGGESDAALRRVAKHGDGWFTFNRPPGELAEPLARLDELLAENGRNRSEITVSACPYMHGLTPEMVEQYAAAGVDQVVALVFAFDAAGVEPAFAGLDACRKDAAHALSWLRG